MDIYIKIPDLPDQRNTLVLLKGIAKWNLRFIELKTKIKVVVKGDIHNEILG